jgi:hypothetical protein
LEQRHAAVIQAGARAGYVELMNALAYQPLREKYRGVIIIPSIFKSAIVAQRI